MQLVLNTYGLQLSQRNRCFQIESQNSNRIISPVRITSILVTKNINITSSAILLAAEFNIPIVFVDPIGQPVVKINSLLSVGLTAIRKQQLELSKTVESVRLSKEMVCQKIQGQLANLAWWANRHVAVAEICNDSKEKIIESYKKMETEWPEAKQHIQKASDYLRGWEAFSAKLYWKGVAAFITNKGWQMEKRSYRPAEDEFNAALNYLYGMLYNQVETALASAGLDSQIGLWHRDNFQTPSLSFDIIEPLRPPIDRLLIDTITGDAIKTGNFEKNEKYGYVVDKKGKEILILSFNSMLEEKVKFNGKITAFKNHILQTAYYVKNVIQSSSYHE